MLQAVSQADCWVPGIALEAEQGKEKLEATGLQVLQESSPGHLRGLGDQLPVAVGLDGCQERQAHKTLPRTEHDRGQAE